MKKINCWEFKKCGRQPGGNQAHSLGACPATTEKKLHGVHGGSQAGRACWIVGGTFCDDAEQGTFPKKYFSCVECDFYKRVKEEEASGFQPSASLFMKLH